MEDHNLSDPDAIPTGTEEQDERIEKAIAENRWVKVDEYSEEWQRIILISINGLTGLSKLVGNLSGNTGAVESRDGKQVEIDDKMMFVNAMDNQLKRVKSVYEHLENCNEITIDDKPIYANFISDIGLCMLTLQEGLSNLGTADFKQIISVVKDTLMESMKKAGFTFNTVTLPYVGEKYEFDTELFYVCPKPEEEDDESE